MASDLYDLSRLLRKAFGWPPDEYGRKKIAIDFKNGDIVQLRESPESEKVVDLSRLRKE